VPVVVRRTTGRPSPPGVHDDHVVRPSVRGHQHRTYRQHPRHRHESGPRGPARGARQPPGDVAFARRHAGNARVFEPRWRGPAHPAPRLRCAP
jgi:hypothetical protein